MNKQIVQINLGMVKAFLVKGEKYILVDTGLPQSFDKINKFFIENKINPKDISTPVEPRSPLAKLIMKLMKQPKIESFKADLLIEEDFNLNKFGIDGKVIHTPGHTGGSLSVLLNNGEAIVGDMLSGKNKKNHTLAKYPFIWNDFNKLKDSIEMLLNKGAKVFYNSHGDGSNVHG